LLHLTPKGVNGVSNPASGISQGPYASYEFVEAFGLVHIVQLFEPAKIKGVFVSLMNNRLIGSFISQCLYSCYTLVDQRGYLVQEVDPVCYGSRVDILGGIRGCADEFFSSQLCFRLKYLSVYLKRLVHVTLYIVLHL